MTATWGLLVGQYKVVRGGYVWLTTALDHVTGTRDDALRALYDHALRFEPERPMGGAFRRLLYQQDDGFLLVSEGGTETFQCRFTVAPLLHNSASPA